MFGTNWLKGSILDLYREDMMRFRVLLTTDIEEDAILSVDEGKIPKLRALNIHNSTVYRWNRPCYGVSPNGKPHLRIENRVLPAGPTVADEVANAALWTGLMNIFDEVYPRFTEKVDFDDIKANFMRAARNGVDVDLTWMQGKKINNIELLKKELIPMAKEGLQKAGVNKDEISKYMDIISERTESGQTGSKWMLGSFSKLMKESSREEVITAITASASEKQKSNQPIHTWELAEIEDITDWEPSEMLVEEFMSTDLITISEKDVPEFAADIMDWQRIRYLPVENEEGHLIGLISSRGVLRHYNKTAKHHKESDACIDDLMMKDPITVSPEQTITEAIKIMRTKKIGCLPVVSKKNLIGIITEANFLNITASMLQRIDRKRKERKESNSQNTKKENADAESLVKPENTSTLAQKEPQSEIKNTETQDGTKKNIDFILTESLNFNEQEAKKQENKKTPKNEPPKDSNGKPSSGNYFDSL
jgi:CBS domain-containing protein